jgi:predicted transcriptional regulator
MSARFVAVEYYSSKLVMLGFLTQHDQNTGRAGGQYYTFELKDEIITTDVHEAFEMCDLSWPSLRPSN